MSNKSITGPSILVRYHTHSLSLAGHDGSGMVLDGIPDEWMPWFIAYGERRVHPLPKISCNVSPFTQEVLTALAALPFGEAISYQQLAERMGRPSAVRAVASACGRNPFPILIPCHRIIGSHGLGGFRFPLAIKQKLLMHEGVTVAVGR